ncbi:Ppx/GppA family phosphatase [Streptomyces phytohabitans]|uniref:Ppx/GppA phosphatase family protein n=1 Tax=Streptomyces phytohabitans TaxID=1150371 RepID=UPI00345C229B
MRAVPPGSGARTGAGPRRPAPGAPAVRERLGVLDAGSNGVRLLVADARGSAPRAVHTAKYPLRLSAQVDVYGRLPDRSVRRLGEAVAAAREEAERWGVDRLFPVATAVVRDAPNRAEALAALNSRTHASRTPGSPAYAPLRVMPGRREAELTFLAARRWMGWRAGPMVLLDIGGGTFDIAFGRNGVPDFAVSVPLGAGRLTREHLNGGDPPAKGDVRSLRRTVRHRLRELAERVRREEPHTAVATSRTFQQLARLCGPPPGHGGALARQTVRTGQLRAAVRQLAGLSAAERAELPGISAARSRQSLAGAVVAHTAMKLMDVEEAVLCPWALREGILLEYLENGRSTAWWNRLPHS